MPHNWRASLKKFKVLLIQVFPVALSDIFLLCMRSATSPLCLIRRLYSETRFTQFKHIPENFMRFLK